MIKWMSASSLVLLLSLQAFSSVYRTETIKSGMSDHPEMDGCIDCFNFIAPTVLGASSVDPAEVGLIVYDAGDNEFKGHKSDGSWAKLSNREVEEPSFLSQQSSDFTSVTAAHWPQMTGNSVTLTPGSWRVSGTVEMGGGAGFLQIAGYWRASNGANTTADPAVLAVDAGLTARNYLFSSGNMSGFEFSMSDIRVTVTVNTPIYLVPMAWQLSTPANAVFKTNIYAEKIR